ncbi:TetR/AcrR family transcriptional regulator [Thalassotalea sp. PLHSN55]|uniref:TetR/AcrR family transcriptional regulator n=1 Tax=Thalassotalea sp. PLHSN55 TaxID=3435888 RepID=UPI003F839F2A
MPALKHGDGNIRQRNKQLIFSAARQEFVQHGFKGASIKRIAEVAQIPRTNVHYYFNDKTDLYQQLLADILDSWNVHCDSLVATVSPKEALTRYIRDKVMFSYQDPDGSKIFASEIIHGAPILKDYLDSDFKIWLQSKVEVIEAWVAKGQMDNINAHHLLFLIWSATQHYADFSVQVCAGLNKDELQEQDFEDVVATLTTIILKGCGIT